ncbi:MAG: hypothetical protein ACRBG0_20825 [Lewinella sp.]|uniref:hypothetical protein n=1 Tax=Lewinella sp. TaxID=2004506 RepID=UPI003D6AA096
MTRIILLPLLALLFFSCKKESVDINQTPEALVYSTSFEDQTTLEQEGWEGLYTLLEDSPASGGSYSLALEPQWLPGVGEASYVPTLAGSGNYHIDFWFKTINWDGTFVINKRLSGSDEEENLLTVSLTEEDWTFASHSLALDLAENESLVVYFSAGGTEVVTGKVLVDEFSIYQE